MHSYQPNRIVQICTAQFYTSNSVCVCLWYALVVVSLTRYYYCSHLLPVQISNANFAIASTDSTQGAMARILRVTLHG